MPKAWAAICAILVFCNTNHQPLDVVDRSGHERGVPYQSLAHLNPTMADQHSPISVDEHLRADLIQHIDREVDWKHNAIAM